MANRFATGKKAFGYCDFCGFRYPLGKLKPVIIKGKVINLLACPTDWSPDQPQLWVGTYPVDDPQALRNPRPDTNLNASRGLFGWNPVGSQQADFTLNDVFVRID